MDSQKSSTGLPVANLVEPGQELPLVMKPTRRAKPATHWGDLDVEQRKEAVVDLGLAKFRAKQASNHYFSRCEDDLSSWTDISEADKAKLATLFPQLIKEKRVQTADQSTTVKTLWELFDGLLVESVLMKYDNRATICISSQAGCGMACPFCATGQGGLQRNMSAGEIVAQAVAAGRMLKSGMVPGEDLRLSNVVFMGMGEPMANYKSVMSAVRTLTTPNPDGLGLSARSVTVSTVGLVPRMRQLATEGLPVTLALSLHAPDDELRNQLVPINNRFSVSEVLDAAWDYAKVTRRRVSIEYIMIKDINDQVARADLLARRLKARGDFGWFHVNLIPLNPTPGSIWTASAKKVEQAFVRRLTEHGVPVTVRDTRGREIDGACGQLAAKGVSGE